MMSTATSCTLLSPVAKKLHACILKIEQSSSQNVEPSLLQTFVKLALQAELEDFVYPGCLLTKILYSPFFCRAKLFEALLKARPELNLVFSALDPHKKKCAFNVIAFKNAQDLWDVIERSNIAISYEILVNTLSIFCSDNIIHQMFALFDRQNPNFDYSTEVQTWFYKNTMSPIFMAADYGHSKVFDFLIEKGCSVFIPDNQDMSSENRNIRACLDFALQRKPLLAHIQKNNGAIDDLAIEKRRAYFSILDLIYKTIASQPTPVTLDRYYADKSNPLHCAISQKDVSLVLKMITLIKKYSTLIGCTIDTPGALLAQTPVMHALRSYDAQTDESDSKIFSMLVAQGAQLDIIDQYGVALFYFLRPDHPVAFAHAIIDKVFSNSDLAYKQRFLVPVSLPPLQKNHDLDYIVHYGLFQGKTIAHHAVFLGHPCIIKKLLDYGVSFQQQDLLGVTPLFSYIASLHQLDLELLKLITKKIMDQGDDVFAIASGFAADSAIDLELQEKITQHINYLEDFNIFELAVFFERIDVAIYLIEQGALAAQFRLNRHFFLTIIINKIKDLHDSSSFFQKFLIPIFGYLKARPEHYSGLVLEELSQLEQLVLSPRIYVRVIEFLDTVFPNLFFENLDTFFYQQALNSFAFQNDSFPDESSLFWYKSFLKRWGAYKYSQNQDLFSTENFFPIFISKLWDSNQRSLIDDFIQQVSLQVREKDSSSQKELYALEKSSFLENLILFCITHDNPRVINVLFAMLDSGAFSRFFEQSDSINQFFDWIDSAYKKIAKDNKELIQHDIDLLYWHVVEYALQHHIDFHLHVEHLYDQSSYWVDRALTHKLIKKTTLTTLVNKQFQKNIVSQSEIHFFIHLCKKIHQLINHKKYYISCALEIDFLLKKMIFYYCSSELLIQPLQSNKSAAESLSTTLEGFITMGLSLSESHNKILYLSILLNTKKLELVELRLVEKDLLDSTDFQSFLERMNPELLSEYDALCQQIKKATLKQKPQAKISAMTASEQLSILPTHSADALSEIGQSSDSCDNTQPWTELIKREKKTTKKVLMPTAPVSFSASKPKENRARKQEAPIIFAISQPEITESKITAHDCVGSKIEALCHDTAVSVPAELFSDSHLISTQELVSEPISSLPEQAVDLQEPSIVTGFHYRTINTAFLFAYRDVGNCTKERLNNLIDFTLEDLYKSLQHKQYQEAVDIWEHLKDYAKTQVPQKISDAINVIQNRDVERAKEMIDDISFQSLLLKQIYGLEGKQHAYFYSDLARQHIKNYHKLLHQAQKQLVLAKQAEIKALSLLKRKSDISTANINSREQKEITLKKILGLK